MSNSNIAIYPGSFDPITNGHVDLVKRTLRVFDTVIVAIAINPDKDRSLFTVAERLQMINDVFADLKGRAEADSFKGLLVDYAERKGAAVVIRGLRAVSDFEYELMLALMNRKLDKRFETVFLMPSERYIYLHSSLVREVYTLGGDVANLVPAPVLAALNRRRKPRAR